MLAPGCDGNDVGESWSSFQWVQGIAERHEVTLLTLHRKAQQSVAEQLPNVSVVQWPDVALPATFERFQSMAKPGYLRFYREAKRWLADARSRGEHFDLVHQVGPLALRYASPAAGFGWPLIIGPLAGSLQTPAGFRRECGHSASWFTRLRNLDSFRLRYDQSLRRSYQKADLILGVAPYVESKLRELRIKRFEIASETGVSELAPVRRPNKGVSLRLLFVGRAVRTKGLRDLIRAMGMLRDQPQISLDVAGKGDDYQRCLQETRRLNLLEKIHFHGQLNRYDVERLYELADLFVFPSFREPSGNVVFEAMRHGLPIVTTKLGGPGYVVNSDSGIRLSAQNPHQLAGDLASAIRKLADDSDLRVRYSEGARARVAEIGLWSNKIKHMLSLYEEVIERSAFQNKDLCHAL
jgi:glycosyltransferase involved in cell wall biosynthesis